MMNTYDPDRVETHEHRAWEGAAPLYVEHVSNLTATSGQLELILQTVGSRPADRVIDVGCGPGVLTAQLSHHVGEVTGVDFSAEMIGEARRHHPELDFQVANAEELPFHADRFELAVVNYCAHHLARPEQAIREIRRVLLPGGPLVIVHPIQSRQPSWGSFAEAVAAVLPPETVPGGALLGVTEPATYVACLRRCGYDDVECHVQAKPVKIRSIDVLLNSGWAISGLHDQPQEIQDQIERGTRDRAERHRNNDGSYTFPDYVLVAHGTA